MPSGELTDQREHSPGARFWIPSHDEWTKAMHWDPDRYGPGDGGYWAYPTRSDEPPITGLPGTGQTNGGLSIGLASSFLPVGSYPDVQSPWGLFDGSGGAQEWTETWFLNGERLYKGSQPGYHPVVWDRIDKINSEFPYVCGMGFRIAAAVPAPGSAGIVILCLVFNHRRRTWHATC